MGTWTPGPSPTSGDDIFNGDSSDENEDGGSGNDQMYGGDGDDTLTGGPGDDLLSGGYGDDILNGSEGNDVIVPGGGSDPFGPGGDEAIGGDGDDVFQLALWTYFATPATSGYGGTADGGDGLDAVDLRFDSYPFAEGLNLDFADFMDAVVYDLTGFSIVNIESVWVSGTPYDDFIQGNDFGFDRLYGFGGNDHLKGLGGDDWLYGGEGNDQLEGFGGQDLLNGEAGNDTLYGGDHNDVLHGGTGNDTLNGEAGDDQLYGEDGVDTLNGGAGDDFLKGDAGADVLNGGDGDDYLQVVVTDLGTGADTIDGGDGTDTLDLQLLSSQGNTFTVTGEAGAGTLSDGSTFQNIEGIRMVGSLGNDTLTAADIPSRIFGGSGADTLTGGAADDTIYGKGVELTGTDPLDGNDILYGLGGNDTLFGEDGDDLLIGGAGNDHIDGGDGNDIAQFSQSLDNYSVLRFGTSLTVVGPDGTDTLNDIENLEFGETIYSYDSFSDGYNTFTGTEGANSFAGSLYADEINGFGGDDILNGLGGNDILNGGAGNDTLDGGEGADILDGGDGDDVFLGLGISGTDRAFGGDGTDTIRLGVAPANLLIPVSLGVGENAEFRIDYITDIERVEWDLEDGESRFAFFYADGEGFSTFLTADGSGLDFVADAGTAVFYGFIYNEITDQTIDLSALPYDGALFSDRPLTGRLFGGDDESPANRFVLAARNTTDGTAVNLTGSAFDDDLYGGNASDFLVGGAGNDILSGRGGMDQMFGGDGNDYIVVNTQGGNADGDYSGEAWDGGAGTDFLAFTGFLDISGGQGGRVVSLEGIAFDVAGGFSTLTMDKAALDDFPAALIVEGIGETDLHTIYLNLATGESVDLSQWQFTNWQEDDWVRVTAGDADETLIGTSQTDFLEGGAGADLLNGGGGVDTAVYTGASAGLVAHLLSSHVNSGDAAGDTYSSIENLDGSAFNDLLAGDHSDNQIFGDYGDDTVFGLDGADRLFGWFGNDQLEGGTGADLLNGGEGFDFARHDYATTGVTAHLAYSWVNTGDAAGDEYVSIEGLVGTGFGDFLAGEAGDNIIYGVGGNDRLYGLDGADQLLGGDGVDFLEGGAGADVIDGGAGYDFARHDNATSGVTAHLLYSFVNEGDAAGDTYVGIEGLVGSYYGDFLAGDGGSNEIYGLGGADRIYGLDGGDLLYGDDGDDFLEGGAGGDLIDGGAGFDMARHDNATAGVQAHLQYAFVNLGDAAGDAYVSIEGLAGSTFGDFLAGNEVDNRIEGLAGNDSLYGLDGADQLFGGDGADFLEGGAGNDLLDGGAGFDFARHDNATSGVTANLASSWVNAGDAAGDAYVSIEGLVGSYYADTLVGDGASNEIYGLSGDDAIYGLGGADQLFGDGGADTFHFFAGDSVTGAEDVLRDFQSGTDRIDLTALRTGASDTVAIIDQGGGVFRINHDQGGDGSIETSILTVGAVTLGDIILTTPPLSPAMFGEPERVDDDDLDMGTDAGTMMFGAAEAFGFVGVGFTRGDMLGPFASYDENGLAVLVA